MRKGSEKERVLVQVLAEELKQVRGGEVADGGHSPINDPSATDRKPPV